MAERELLLLGLLRRENMHGYKLNEFIENDLAICTDLKKPTAYFLLDKMAKQGWIEQYDETQSGGRPPRRMFRITAAGESVFQDLLRARLKTFDPARFTADPALAFVDALDSAEAHALLSQRRAGLAAELDTMRAVPEHPGTFGFVIAHRIAHLEAELRWIDDVIAHLRAL
ncbi:MAG: helix-turn-helix transcriptional regulator [Anaerolinea sp.]|nr:helix-turn-helix transcriptional regulator [Anaerolinea sp.]